MSPSLEARRAIEEYCDYLKDHGLGKVGSDLALEAFGLIARLSETDPKREYPEWTFNLDLHAAEAKLDERIEEVRELRRLMERVVMFALDLAIQRCAGKI